MSPSSSFSTSLPPFSITYFLLIVSLISLSITPTGEQRGQALLSELREQNQVKRCWGYSK